MDTKYHKMINSVFLVSYGDQMYSTKDYKSYKVKLFENA